MESICIQSISLGLETIDIKIQFHIKLCASLLHLDLTLYIGGTP